MAEVAILGAGGMGRETQAWLLDQCADGNDVEVVGYLDDDRSLTGAVVGGLPVLGDLGWLEGRRVRVAVAIGDPAARRAAIARLRRRGHGLVTVVHPTAVVGPRVRLGEASIVCPRAVLTTDIELGEAVIVNFGAVIGHDTTIGSYATIAPAAALAGGVAVGEAAEIGIGAVVLEGRSVGAGTIVGGGAVVTRSLPDGVTAVGVPARARPDAVPMGQAG